MPLPLLEKLEAPAYYDEKVALYSCTEFALLNALPDDSVDAVITDPPYSSGGMTRSDRMQTTQAKYVMTGGKEWTSFSGDNRDQRGWAFWCGLWLQQCLRVVRESGYIMLFTDWRQLPLTTDVLQAGGFCWRGIFPWDKGPSARAPHTGFFRHQCEYVVWGTKGVSVPAEHGGPLPGFFYCPHDLSDKWHQTGKPLVLMRDMVKMIKPGGIIVDPFAGSSTTLLAAREEGRLAYGCEVVPDYRQISRERLDGSICSRRGERQASLFTSDDEVPPPVLPDVPT